MLSVWTQTVCEYLLAYSLSKLIKAEEGQSNGEKKKQWRVTQKVSVDISVGVLRLSTAGAGVFFFFACTVHWHLWHEDSLDGEAWDLNTTMTWNWTLQWGEDRLGSTSTGGVHFEASYLDGQFVLDSWSGDLWGWEHHTHTYTYVMH